jgi:acetyl-CoA carboxylase biotin carboxylase subunit
MRTALSEVVIDGINTNIALHEDIFKDAGFKAGGTNIHYLEKKLEI